MCGELPAVPFDDPAANSQPHAATLVFLAAVQSLEWLKDSIQVLLVKADSVIFYLNLAGGRCCFCGDLNLRRPALLVELQRIVDQILEQLMHLSGIRFNDWQVTQFDLTLSSVNLILEV